MSESTDFDTQQQFKKAVQATVMQAMASSNLTVEADEEFIETAEDVDLAATQELNLAEIDW